MYITFIQMFSSSVPNHLKYKADKFLKPDFQFPKDQSSADGRTDECRREIKGCLYLSN